MTYVLITRPEEDCHAMSTQLQAPFVCEPMLMIHPLLKTLPLKPSITDLIITSPRIFDIIENIQDYKTKPVWCVGEITAEKAKKKGFESIYVAERSAQDLLEKIVQESHRDKSFFLHLRGDKVHVDVASALNHVGFHAEQIIVYEAKAVQEFSPRVKTLIKDHLISLIPFYSQRTAEVFVDLVKRTFNQSEIDSLFKNMIALVHSESVAQKTKDLPWKNVVISPNLGASQIDAIYSKHFGPKAEIDCAETPSRSQLLEITPTKSQIPLFAGVSLVASVVGALAFALVTSLPIFSKKQDGVKNDVSAEILKLIEDRLSTNEQALHQMQSSLQLPSSEFPQLGSIENDIARIRQDIGSLSERVLNLENASTHRVEMRAKEESSPQKSQELSHDYQNFITYQRLLGSQHELLTSELSLSNQQFLMNLGIPTQGVLSIPQLLTQLDSLDFSYSTTEIPKTEGIFGEILSRLDIKVQHKSKIPLKDSIIADLKKGNFTFLDPIKLNEDVISRLSSEVIQWLKKARLTAQVKDRLTTEINLLQASTQPKKAAPESSIITGIPTESPMELPLDESR